MTDNEIIKALECCSVNAMGECKECPLLNDFSPCGVTLTTNALDLINRQKAEIDILIRKKETVRDEISQLQNEVETWKRTAEYNAKKYAELIKEMEGD